MICFTSITCFDAKPTLKKLASVYSGVRPRVASWPKVSELRSIKGSKDYGYCKHGQILARLVERLTPLEPLCCRYLHNLIVCIRNMQGVYTWYEVWTWDLVVVKFTKSELKKS